MQAQGAGKAHVISPELSRAVDKWDYQKSGMCAGTAGVFVASAALALNEDGFVIHPSDLESNALTAHVVFLSELMAEDLRAHGGDLNGLFKRVASQPKLINYAAWVSNTGLSLQVLQASGHVKGVMKKQGMNSRAVRADPLFKHCRNRPTRRNP